MCQLALEKSTQGCRSVTGDSPWLCCTRQPTHSRPVGSPHHQVAVRTSQLAFCVLLPVLQVGEYCEVFNDSKTDPAAWVARIQKVGRGNYTVGGWVWWFRATLLRIRWRGGMLVWFNRLGLNHKQFREVVVVLFGGVVDLWMSILDSGGR